MQEYITENGYSCKNLLEKQDLQRECERVSREVEAKVGLFVSKNKPGL